MAALFILSLAFLSMSSISVETDHKLYHSASIFSQDYQEMLDRFKLYIYPRIEHPAAPDIRDSPTTGTMDRLFLDSLSSSRYVTEDPDQAQLLILPASVSALWRKGGSSSEKMIAHSFKAYVQQLRDRFPYWQRALGADHVFISCQDFKSDWSRNVLELRKNAIQLACFPLANGGEQEFLPHKDITMPSKSMAKPPPKPAKKRVRLAFYSASERASVPASWKSDHDFVSRSFNESKYMPALQSTNFCLSLGPRDRQLVLDSLTSGCIPVIFATGRLSDLPFQDILDWNQFAIVLRQDQLHHTKSILEAVDETSRLRLREYGARAAKHMEWNSPPRLHDAFYMVLYQLWRRHYIVRYTDRTPSLV